MEILNRWSHFYTAGINKDRVADVSRAPRIWKTIFKTNYLRMLDWSNIFAPDSPPNRIKGDLCHTLKLAGRKRILGLQ